MTEEVSDSQKTALFEQGMDPAERKKLFRSVSRLVIKVGTTSITTDTGINEKFLDDLTGQIEKLIGRGIEVIIVTSGAIGVGLQVLGIDAKPREIPVRQAAAAAGQS